MRWRGQELGGEAVEVTHSMDQGAWPKEEIQQEGSGIVALGAKSGDVPLRVADFSPLPPSPLF